MCSKSKGRFHFLNVIIISELPCNPFAKKGNSLKSLIDNLPQQRKKRVFFFVMRSPCTTLLRQVRLRLGITMKKTRFFLCYALALHYFASPS